MIGGQFSGEEMRLCALFCGPKATNGLNLYLLDAQSNVKVLVEQIVIHQVTSKSLTRCSFDVLLYIARGLTKIRLNEPEK